MGSVSGKKCKATHEINENDQCDSVVDEEATVEGLVAEVLGDPREVGADAVVFPTQTSDKFPFLITLFVLCIAHDSLFYHFFI
jgi:hypothetical protein